jgi:GT2 family glycosyltransferase/SAM-dependent methyltransferase
MSDPFYRAFEEKFRGSRSLIRSRLGVYRAFISPLKLTMTGPRGLDLGCGRGEWLEVLQEEGIEALGVDLDDGMLEACRALQLPALKGDAVVHLAGLPSESLAVISAFHMVEHIPFEVLQRLVSEAHRVLVPGGLLIMETPNPENIAVATRDFYLDPTHQRPIPPQLLGYLPEYFGFHRSKTLRLQQSARLEQDPRPSLMDVIAGASPDYAVVAQKAASPSQLAAFDAAFGVEYGLSLQRLTDRYDAAHATKVQQADAIAQQAKAMGEQALSRVRHLTEAHALMEQQMAMTSQYVSQVDQRAVATEQQLHAMLNSTSWRVTAPLRWVGIQLGLWRAQGLRGRLAAVLHKFGVLKKPAQPEPAAAPAPVQESSAQAAQPATRLPSIHAEIALADPALAALPRPVNLAAVPASGQPAGGVEHEPLLHLSVLQDSPAALAFVVLVGPADGLPAIRNTMHAILRQTDPAWELVFHVHESSAHLVDEWLDADWRIRRCVHPRGTGLTGLGQTFAMSTGRFVGMVEAGDTVDDDLVKLFNRAASMAEDADVLYCDELWQAAEPGLPAVEVRKPDWSPEQQMSVDILGRFCAIRKTLVLTCEIWDSSQADVVLYGLNLEAATRARRVVHVPELLYERRPLAGAARPGGFFPPAAWADLQQGVRHFLQRHGQTAEVQMNEALGSLMVRPEVPAGLAVTVVILTAMRVREVPGRGTILLAENFVRSIIDKTTYPNYRILLVDDGVSSQALTQLLTEHGHRVASYEAEGPFSFARKSNFATSLADDGVVILLNDDMEVLSPQWLHWLVAHAAQPSVGVAGAKLLFADDTIQHAGMVVGLHGSCGHALHQQPSHGAEYLGLASIDRNCSAVTGAAMAYRKSVFEGLGGFDEAFRVDYNDIDFCLRCIESNLRVVFASQAVLYHFHNSSFERPHDDASERELFQSRWPHLLKSDRYFPAEMLKQSLASRSTEGS